MVPHMSGTTLDAQARYAAGVKKILENYFSGKPQTPSDVIVENGQYATKYALHLDIRANFTGLMVNASKCIFLLHTSVSSSPLYFSKNILFMKNNPVFSKLLSAVVRPK